MGQFNIIPTPKFARDLEFLMRVRGIRTQSDAIRIAVQEIANRGAVPELQNFKKCLEPGCVCP